MSFFEKKQNSWSSYFSNLGKSISSGTADVVKGAESIATDSKTVIDTNLGTKMGGKRKHFGGKSRRKTRRKMSRRNSKSRRQH